MKVYILNLALNSYLLDNAKSYGEQTETTNSYFMMTIPHMLKSLITTNMTMQIPSLIQCLLLMTLNHLHL